MILAHCRRAVIVWANRAGCQSQRKRGIKRRKSYSIIDRNKKVVALSVTPAIIAIGHRSANTAGAGIAFRDTICAA